MMRPGNNCCGNEAGLVQKFIGSAYDVVKNVHDNLEEIKFIFDFMAKYDVLLCVESLEELKKVNWESSKFVRMYLQGNGSKTYVDYIYVADDKSGVIPDHSQATGSWVKVNTLLGAGGSNAIPWLYNNGSANGGEVNIHVEEDAIGVSEIFINGLRKHLGIGYTYEPVNRTIQLSTALVKGDQLVAKLIGYPALPNTPNISEFMFVNWVYNNGTSIGGETKLKPPYTFQKVPAVYINGLRKLENHDYVVGYSDYSINLTLPLKINDVVIVQLGGEADAFSIDTYTAREALRRTYSEAGLILVNGSFEDGAKVTTKQDVVLERKTGRAYNWQGNIPSDGKVIPAGSTPASAGGIGADKWQDLSNVTYANQREFTDGNQYTLHRAFEAAVTLTQVNEAVQFSVGGIFYRWDGVFPQGGLVIPKGTPNPSPDQTGLGKYIAVLDLEVKDQIFGVLSKPDSESYLGTTSYSGVRQYTGSNDTLRVFGKHNIFDGGYGVFKMDAQDISSHDNSGTVLVDQAGRRWKRQYTGLACVEWFEGDSDRMIIKTALSAKIPLQFTPNRDYTWDGTDAMVIDVGYTSIQGNAARIIFTGFTDSVDECAIKFTNTLPRTPSDYWVPQGITKPINGLILIGPKGSGEGAAYLSKCAAVLLNTAHIDMGNCFIYGFGDGVRITTEGYTSTFRAVNIAQCAIGVNSEAGGANYGESIEFIGCKIFDNKVGISNNCQTGVVRMIGGSLDYNIKQVQGTNASITELNSTWFECNDAGIGNVHVDLSGRALFAMTGGHLQQHGAPGALDQAGLLRTDRVSKARFKNVFMFNCKNKANVLDCGEGQCLVVDADSYEVSYLPSRIAPVANNLLSDGSFAISSVADMWFLQADTAAITDRLIGTNIKIEVSSEHTYSGANALKLSKVSGGAPGSVSLCVPVGPRGNRVAITGKYYKPAAASSSATIYVTTQAAKIEGVKPNGCPNILNSMNFDTLAIGGTDALIDWTNIETGMDRVLPSWATHFLVTFNCQNFQGTLFLDDFNISAM